MRCASRATRQRQDHHFISTVSVPLLSIMAMGSSMTNMSTMAADMAEYMSWLNPHTSCEDQAIADLIYRFTEGIDDNDVYLLFSTLTSDARLDLSEEGSALNIHWPPLEGRDLIISQLSSLFLCTETTHNCTNVRINRTPQQSNAAASLTPLKASIRCNVSTTYYRLGEGPDPKKRNCLATGSRWNVKAIRDMDGYWKICEIVGRCMWAHGDVGVVDPIPGMALTAGHYHPSQGMKPIRSWN